MKKIFRCCLFAVLSIAVSSGCKKETENYPTASLGDYFPLEVGKTFLYRLDSTVPASFGSVLVIKSYQALDSIESTFTDNQGRLSYRIFRLIRDTAGLQPWQFAGTYVATPTGESIEYVDNNLRFIKLHAPVAEGYSWPAHSFIDTKSVNSTVSYLDGWQYQYQNTGKSFTVSDKVYDSTVTVFQQDDTSPPGLFDPNNYQQRNYGVEVFAKNVGLIYKEFLHWTWQPTPPPAKFEDGSYGVKLSMISHN